MAIFEYVWIRCYTMDPRSYTCRRIFEWSLSWSKALYDREVGITFKTGTLLVYRHDLWHRGTPLLPTSTRYVQNIVYKLPHCHWLHNWNQGAAKYIYEKKKYVERLIAQLDVNQRSCLGIPLPGHVYWTKLTIAAVEKRYGCFGMDMSPYLQALSNQNLDVYPTDIVWWLWWW